MKIFYLRDWDENKYDTTLRKILSSKNDDFISLDVNYKITKNIIDDLSNKLYRKNKESIIIGRGFGAYLGLNISYKILSPCILFNPTIFFKNGPEFRYQEIHLNSDFKPQIIISAKHKDIDVKKTLKYFDSIGFSNYVKVYDELDENIPYDVIENEFINYKSLFNFEKPKDFISLHDYFIEENPYIHIKKSMFRYDDH